MRSRSGRRSPPVSRRISTCTASLPSTSPPWMFASRNTTGRPAGRSAGRLTAGFDSVTKGIGRPSSVVPNVCTRTSGDFAASAERNAVTSSRRLVSSKFVRSGRVCSGSGLSCASGTATARVIVSSRAVRIIRVARSRRCGRVGILSSAVKSRPFFEWPAVPTRAALESHHVCLHQSSERRRRPGRRVRQCHPRPPRIAGSDDRSPRNAGRAASRDRRPATGEAQAAREGGEVVDRAGAPAPRRLGPGVGLARSADSRAGPSNHHGLRPGSLGRAAGLRPGRSRQSRSRRSTCCGERTCASSTGCRHRI